MPFLIVASNPAKWSIPIPGVRITSAKEFTLSINFDMEPRFEKLSTQLASLFRAPLIRAQFIKQKRWILQTNTHISMIEIPDDHRPFPEKFAGSFFQERSFRKTNLKK